MKYVLRIYPAFNPTIYKGCIDQRRLLKHAACYLGSQPPSDTSQEAGLRLCIRLSALLEPCWRPLALLGMACSSEGFHDALITPRLPLLLLLTRLLCHVTDHLETLVSYKAVALAFKAQTICSSRHHGTPRTKQGEAVVAEEACVATGGYAKLSARTIAFLTRNS